MVKFAEIVRNIYEPIAPKHFDENEWWIIFLLILISCVVFYIHKKTRILTTSELLVVFFFNIYYASIGDYILAMDPVDLYDTIDLNSGELFDMPLHFLVYPGVIYIALHIYFLLKPKKSLYILFWTILLVFFEWISVHFFHLFTYKGWNLLFSFLFYLVVMTVNLLLLTKIRKSFRKSH